jgi:two-component system chemotaxis response regulator CheY
MPESARQVLVVEDSAAMRGFVTATLEGAGAYEVTQAESGFHALRLLPRTRFHLVISDINMPDINGLELARFLRERGEHKDTPLILISTDGREADRERGMKLGADAYLVKPFSPEELISLVEKLVASPVAPVAPGR